MRATILADASYCPRTGAAGWGFWIASDRGKHGGGGELRRPASSTAAEMMAVVNALHVATQQHSGWLVQQGDDVLIQTDCQAAILAFMKKRAPGSGEQEVLDKFNHIVQGTRIRVDFRHVKGHTNRNTHTGARFGANRACDARARDFMRQARARIDGHPFD